MDRFPEGIVIGKFLPPTQGHERLVNFGASLCERLTVVVDCVPWQDFDAPARADWLRERFAGTPNVRFVALAEPTPQEPGDHPDFWNVWRDLLYGAGGGKPDVLFASERYGVPLADVLGCAFMPLDVDREGVPISATRVRGDLWENWWMVTPQARRAYLRRVALEGPESTGKSTLGQHLAERFGFTYSPEWAKGFIEFTVREGRPFVESDLLTIARGQTASERSLEPSADRVMIHDSTLLTTMVWGLFRYGRIDPRIEAVFWAEEARAPRERLFLTPETPFVDDVHRRVADDPDLPETRERFMDLLMTEAERRNLPYRLLRGGHEAKRAQAEDILGALRAPTLPHPPRREAAVPTP